MGSRRFRSSTSGPLLEPDLRTPVDVEGLEQAAGLVLGQDLRHSVAVDVQQLDAAVEVLVLPLHVAADGIDHLARVQDDLIAAIAIHIAAADLGGGVHVDAGVVLGEVLSVDLDQVPVGDHDDLGLLVVVQVGRREAGDLLVLPRQRLPQGVELIQGPRIEHAVGRPAQQGIIQAVPGQVHDQDLLGHTRQGLALPDLLDAAAGHLKHLHRPEAFGDGEVHARLAVQGLELGQMPQAQGAPGQVTVLPIRELIRSGKDGDGKHAAQNGQQTCNGKDRQRQAARTENGRAHGQPLSREQKAGVEEIITQPARNASRKTAAWAAVSGFWGKNSNQRAILKEP